MRLVSVVEDQVVNGSVLLATLVLGHLSFVVRVARDRPVARQRLPRDLLLCPG